MAKPPAQRVRLSKRFGIGFLLSDALSVEGNCPIFLVISGLPELANGAVCVRGPCDPVLDGVSRTIDTHSLQNHLPVFDPAVKQEQHARIVNPGLMPYLP